MLQIILHGAGDMGDFFCDKVMPQNIFGQEMDGVVQTKAWLRQLEIRKFRIQILPLLQTLH